MGKRKASAIIDLPDLTGNKPEFAIYRRNGTPLKVKFNIDRSEADEEIFEDTSSESDGGGERDDEVSFSGHVDNFDHSVPLFDDIPHVDSVDSLNKEGTNSAPVQDYEVKFHEELQFEREQFKEQGDAQTNLIDILIKRIDQMTVREKLKSISSGGEEDFNKYENPGIVHSSECISDDDQSKMRNYFLDCIHKSCALLFGCDIRKSIPAPPDEVKMGKIESAFVHGRQLPMVLVPHWTHGANFEYNKVLSSIFTSRFIQQVEGGSYDLRRLSGEYLKHDVIQTAFDSYVFGSLRTRWLHQGTAAVKDKLKKNRRQRRERLFGARRKACESSVEYRDYMGILLTIGSDGMSSDEEIIDEDVSECRDRVKTFEVIEKEWRSAVLNAFLACLDKLHKKGLKVPPSRAHRRIRPSQPRYSEDAAVPKGLPLDCYSDLCLQKLSLRDKLSLNISTKVVFEDFKWHMNTK